MRFVLLFLGSYTLLSILYAIYLKLSDGGKYFPDFVTQLVARQSNGVLSGFGYNSALVTEYTFPGISIQLNERIVGGIVEGCNSLSIIILFISFVIAFAENFKKTFLFLLAGAVLIYVVNIFRIVILVVALYNYPDWESFLHKIIFPGIIYGMVFFLWILWVKMLKPKPVHG